MSIVNKLRKKRPKPNLMHVINWLRDNLHPQVVSDWFLPRWKPEFIETKDSTPVSPSISSRKIVSPEETIGTGEELESGDHLDSIF